MLDVMGTAVGEIFEDDPENLGHDIDHEEIAEGGVSCPFRIFGKIAGDENKQRHMEVIDKNDKRTDDGVARRHGISEEMAENHKNDEDSLDIVI